MKGPVPGRLYRLKRDGSLFVPYEQVIGIAWDSLTEGGMRTLILFDGTYEPAETPKGPALARAIRIKEKNISSEGVQFPRTELTDSVSYPRNGGTVQREKYPYLNPGAVMIFGLFVFFVGVAAAIALVEDSRTPNWETIEAPDAEVTCWRHRKSGAVACSPVTRRGLEC